MSFQDTIPESKDLIKSPSTPIKRSLIIHSLIKEDLSSSFILNLSSPVITEELLINEKIDFLSNDSELSVEHASLTYTKTLNSKLSSIFPSFEGSNLFLNSVPYSHNESLSVKFHEITAPQGFLNDIKIEYLKIPSLTVSNLLRLQNIREEAEKDEIFEILNGGKSERDTPVFDEIKSAGKEFEIELENDKKICSCSLCVIS